MREYKFRVWNDFIKKYETLQEVASRGAIMPRGNELKTTVNYPLIIEQFTGLHDKNGVEIYEGDIVQECGLRETWTLSRRDEFSERKHVITWCDYDAQWCGQLIEDDEDYELDTRLLSFLERKYTLEVISNIHEEVVE